MADYRFVTHWRIEAPAGDVWEAIFHSEHWPDWWSSVRRVIDVSPGDDRGIGAVRRYVWRSRLPYTLTFDVRATRIERPTLLEGVASGELAGTGLWQFSTNGTVTTVQHTWEVQTTRGWMNLLAPAARALFAWNHAYSMHEGARGLARLLRARLLESSHA